MELFHFDDALDSTINGHQAREPPTIVCLSSSTFRNSVNKGTGVLTIQGLARVDYPPAVRTCHRQQGTVCLYATPG